MSRSNTFISKFKYVVIFSLIGLLAACGGSGSGSGSGAPKMTVSGGDSATGNGGIGGNINVQKFGGVGAVTINSAGTADASYTATTGIPDLGSVPIVATVDYTILLDPAAGIAAGEIYLLTGVTDLYVSDGDGNLTNDVVATGVQVNAGVTVTIPLNADAGTTAEIRLTNDVDNRGTITSADVSATQRGNLAATFLSYHGASGSTVDTSGSIAGQDGGDILLVTLGLTSNTNVYNRGNINSYGAADPSGTGGNGGDIFLAGFEALENSGTLNASGGDGGAGAGGAAGGVSITTGVDPIFNSGNILASGGSASTSGGAAGSIELVPGTFFELGALRNSGNLSANGGSGGTGAGGSGANITLIALGDSVTNSGDLEANGASTDAATGGSGGTVTIVSISTAPDRPAGDVLVSGALSVTGGADSGSNTAGDGGTINIIADVSGSVEGLDASVVIPATAPVITLSGYSQIDLNGGAGQTGGNAGVFYAEDNGEDWGGSNYVDAAGGSLVNEASINAKGGAVSSGATAPADGGDGGSIFLYVDSDDTVDGAETVVNNGDLNVSSGGAFGLTTFSANGGGLFDLYGTSDVTNNGNITADGGGDSLTGTLGIGFGHAAGGNGGASYLADSINGNASNSGTVSAKGGTGDVWGGSSTLTISFNGVVITNSGSISTDGGNASALGFGGDAGDITFSFNADPIASCTLGALSLSGGTGGLAGSDGTLDTSDCP